MATSATVDRLSQPNEETLRDMEKFREVWDGEDYMPAAPNNEHYGIAMLLGTIYSGFIEWDRGERSLPGGNVSDRVQGWTSNYRIPDVLVALRGGRAINRGSFWEGGPDIVVEIASDGEDPLAKRDFYELIGVREFVIVERRPWAVELFQLQSDRLVSVGRSDEANGAILDSAVLPVRYRVMPGSTPLRVEVTNLKTNQTWNLAG